MRLYQNRNSNDFILDAHKSFPIWHIVKNWNTRSCTLSVKCKKHFLTEEEKGKEEESVTSWEKTRANLNSPIIH